MLNARMQDIKQLIEQKEAQKVAIDKEIEALKIELANIVLNDMDKEPVAQEVLDDDMVTFVGVRFNNGGKVYDYIWAGEKEIREGDSVLVSTKWGTEKVVEVVQVHKGIWDGSIEYKHAYSVEE